MRFILVTQNLASLAIEAKGLMNCWDSRLSSGRLKWGW
jgi:hypothetical protein